MFNTAFKTFRQSSGPELAFRILCPHIFKRLIKLSLRNKGKEKVIYMKKKHL